MGGNYLFGVLMVELRGKSLEMEGGNNRVGNNEVEHYH